MLYEIAQEFIVLLRYSIKDVPLPYFCLAKRYNLRRRAFVAAAGDGSAKRARRWVSERRDDVNQQLRGNGVLKSMGLDMSPVKLDP